MTFIVMTSLGNVAIEIIPQGTAFCYSFAVGKRTWRKCRSVWDASNYGDKYFTRLAIYVWCQKFAHGRESVVDEEEPGRNDRSGRFPHAVKKM